MKVHLQKSNTTSSWPACDCGSKPARVILEDAEFEQAKNRCKWCERLFAGRQSRSHA